MSMLGTQQPTEYNDGMTKQAFKQETDVNYLVEKHTRMGTISHLEQWGGQYGDLAGFNFQEAQNQIAHANSLFEKLPSSIRNQFANSPQKFFEFVNDPENKDDLAKKLPELAKRGSRPLPTNADVEDPTPPTPPSPEGGDTPAEPTP